MLWKLWKVRREDLGPIFVSCDDPLRWLNPLKQLLTLFIDSSEDDEFEEFDPAHWNKDAMEEEAQQQWMENWDDNMDCDFTKNLREELLKSSK